MFGAITLCVISRYDGYLSPSTAFTALAIFQRLEETLSLVPGLATDFSNALISIRRIEHFLTSPEREDSTLDADHIELEGAAIAWPSDERIPRLATLQDMNISFPEAELSIIAGPTASGKSLLLAAVIGEADILSGSVQRPRRVWKPLKDSSTRADERGWLVRKSIAFVAQTPWIENSSIRDNILFGLPLIQPRYDRVLQACALQQDLDIMEDKDNTEVGAQGISLSGGQRSRLALARALYSRAETLVIDDVLSAVDAHVARHLVDNALTGELVRGRTRLLVTHSVHLCLPKAKLVVMLRNGTVERAEKVGSLRKDDSLSQEPNAESNGGHTLDEKRNETLPVKSSENFRERPSAMTSGASSEQPRADTQPEVGKDVETGLERCHASKRPRKLVEEEQRARGSTKLTIFQRYLRAGSSWPWLYWSSVVALLIA